MLSLNAESTSCVTSIWDTRVPWYLPDVRSSRRTHPSTHPDATVCRSYKDRPSCCSAETLKSIHEWSMSLDGLIEMGEYGLHLAQEQPEALVDQGILLAMSTPQLSELNIDWSRTRQSLRTPLANFMRHVSQVLTPALVQQWGAFATYFEGLLCSACEPNMGAFMLNQTIFMKGEAAYNVADAMIGVFRGFDSLVTDEAHRNELEQIFTKVCMLGHSEPVCKVMASFMMTYITGPSLPNMLCDGNYTDLQASYAHCSHFVQTKLLRGLYIDTLVFTENGMRFGVRECQKISTTCESMESVTQSIQKMRFSFDTRPIAINHYSEQGFDTHSVACGSKVSSFTCGGHGPSSRTSNPENTGGSSVASAVFTTLSVIVVLGCAGLLFMYRRRVQGFAQGFYSRILDDGHSGPTVALV